jgi:hypothetical protein
MVIVLLNIESIQPTSSLVQLSRLYAAIPSLAVFVVWLAVSAVSSPVKALECYVPTRILVLCKIIFTPQIQQHLMKHPFPRYLALGQLLGCLRRLLKIDAKIQDKLVRVRYQLEKNSQFDAIALL